MAKRIGIVCHSGLKSTLFGIGKQYVRFLRKFGEPVLIFPYSKVVENIDLLVLPGGADVNPLRYDEVPDILTQRSDIALEYFDEHVLPLYLEKRIPIFGICRGYQSASVVFGAKLIQHVDNEYSLKHRGELVDSVEFYKEASEILPIDKKYFPSRAIKGWVNKLYKTNSLHHQCVDIDNLGENLLALGVNVYDNHLEAVCAKDYPFIGVQWHPEELKNPMFSTLAINSLLNGTN